MAAAGPLGPHPRSLGPPPLGGTAGNREQHAPCAAPGASCRRTFLRGARSGTLCGSGGAMARGSGCTTCCGPAQDHHGGQSIGPCDRNREPRGYDDAAPKISGRKRPLQVDTLGLWRVVRVPSADVPDRDGARPVMVQADPAVRAFSTNSFPGPNFSMAGAADERTEDVAVVHPPARSL